MKYIKFANMILNWTLVFWLLPGFTIKEFFNDFEGLGSELLSIYWIAFAFSFLIRLLPLLAIYENWVYRCEAINSVNKYREFLERKED